MKKILSLLVAVEVIIVSTGICAVCLLFIGVFVAQFLLLTAGRSYCRSFSLAGVGTV